MVDISQLIASAKAKVGKVAQKFDRDQSMPGFQFAQGGLRNRVNSFMATPVSLPRPVYQAGSNTLSALKSLPSSQYVMGRGQESADRIIGGIQGLQRPGIGNKIMGGMSLLSGGLSLTPAGQAREALVGAPLAGIKTGSQLLSGQPVTFGENVRRGVTGIESLGTSVNPLTRKLLGEQGGDIASQALDIGNMALGMYKGGKYDPETKFLNTIRNLPENFNPKPGSILKKLDLTKPENLANTKFETQKGGLYELKKDLGSQDKKVIAKIFTTASQNKKADLDDVEDIRALGKKYLKGVNVDRMRPEAIITDLYKHAYAPQMDRFLSEVDTPKLSVEPTGGKDFETKRQSMLTRADEAYKERMAIEKMAKSPEGQALPEAEKAKIFKQYQSLVKEREKLLSEATMMKKPLSVEPTYAKPSTIEGSNSGTLKQVEETSRVMRGEISRLRKALEEAPIMEKTAIRMKLLNAKSKYADLQSLTSQLKSGTERLAQEQGKTTIKPLSVEPVGGEKASIGLSDLSTSNQKTRIQKDYVKPGDVLENSISGAKVNVTRVSGNNIHFENPEVPGFKSSLTWKELEDPSKGWANSKLSPLGGSVEPVGGKPIRAFHGTDEDFTEFDLSHVGKNTDSGMFGKGFYFTDDQAYAKTYARKTGKTKEVELDLKNPLILNTQADIPKIDVPNKTLDDLKNGATNYSKAFAEYAKANGYDGVIDNISGGKRQYVVFDPKKIKIISPSKPLSVEPAGGKVVRVEDPEIRKIVNSNDKSPFVQEFKKNYERHIRSMERGDLTPPIAGPNKGKQVIDEKLAGKWAYADTMSTNLEAKYKSPSPLSGKVAAQGGLSDVSSPKGIRTGQEMDGVDQIGTPELGTPLLSGRSIRTKASSEVSSQPIISNKGKLNLERLAVDDKAKQALQDINNGIPTSVISNKSVIEKAKMAKGSNKPMSDEQMQDLLAQQLKNRQTVVDLSAKFSKAKADGASEAELGKIMLELANQSRTAQQGGTFAGRLLQAQNIVADQSATPMQKILALLDNAGVSQEKYLKDSVKVNWENPTEVVKFYRKYVPPKLGEVITEIRYTNMLSSPLTHITNIASNALQTGLVTPVEKTVTGLLDAVRSSITGKERQYYASAGINYTKGYLKSLPDAWQKAKNIMNQTETTIRPDMEYMPTGVGGPLQAYTTPLRALEAMDQFFKTLVQGGVTKELQTGPKKLSQTQIGSQAGKEADYRLFRQAFDPSGELGQGGVLQMFDKWNSAINGLRRLPGGKWVLPFLQTPTNILKQGVEYSPLGVITAPGSKAPLEQLSKALIGTGVYATAYQLASSGLTSWEAPSGEKERSLYYAAGMQPYSIKMGDKWVSFSKLGPLSYPIAMAAALADAEKKNPDKTKTENIAKSISGMLGFFGDQSYVRSIGDLVDAIQGGVNVGPSAISGQASNLAGQLIPYKSFQTWLGRIIDPTYRKAQTFTEKLTKDLPILGSKLEPYTDLQGNPSQRDLPLLNAISPYKVTQEKSSNVPVYEQYQQNRIKTQQINRAKEKIKSGQEVDSIGGVYLNMDGGTVDVGKVSSMPSTSGYDKVKKEEATFKIIDDVMKLPIDQQEDALKKLGVTPDDAQYYTVAKSSVEAKTAYVMDGLEKMINQGATRDQALNALLKMRNEVNGEQIASDNVLKALYDQNIISKQDYNNLKQVKVSGGQIKRKAVGRAKKAKMPEYNFKALMKPTKVARRGKVKIKRIKI